MKPTALNIKGKEKIVDNTPKALNLGSRPQTQNTIQNQKKFDLSFAYLKSKIPELNNFNYQSIKIILDKLERTDSSKMDTDILELGKNTQEKISDFAIKQNQEISVLKIVQNSHILIIDTVKTSKEQDNFFKKMFGKSTSIEEYKSVINNEYQKNKEYYSELKQPLSCIQKEYNTFDKLKDEISLYTNILMVLSDEFEKEGYLANKDLLNKRIISIKQSETILNTTKAVIELNKSKIVNYIDNIDSIINIYVPTIITKMNSDNYRNDSEYFNIVQSIEGMKGL